MAVPIINPSLVSIHMFFEGTVLVANYNPPNASPVAIDASGLDITVPTVTSSVPIVIEFIDDDPNATLAGEHLDALGLQCWPGGNPRSYTFGVTSGFIDVTATVASNSGSGSRVLPIRVKPQTERPWG